VAAPRRASRAGGSGSLPRREASAGDAATEETLAEGVVPAALLEASALTAKLRAAKMARVLNEYLDAMTGVVFEQGGTIDKFVGDAVMVIFGAPEELPPKEQVARACACGRAMHESAARLATGWEAEGVPPLTMRIGIHHGPVVVGSFGSELRSDYTAIGPVVNLASRIESTCEPGRVFVSGAVADYLPEESVEEAGAFELKGVPGSRSLYRLV